MTTRVGSPSVWESTTWIASGASSGIDLHRLDLGVELASRRTLLPASRARCLHAAEWRMWIDAGRVAIDANEAHLDARDVTQRRPDVVGEERGAEAILRRVGQLDRAVEIIGGEGGEH